MWSERVVNWWCGFEWCILNTEKLWTSNKFKKMKSLCNRRVSVWNPDTSKDIVRFVHEVHSVFAITLSTFLHMLCGWNDDTMPTFNLCNSSFEMLFNFRVILLKIISKCMKNNNWSQKGLKIDDVAFKCLKDIFIHLSNAKTHIYPNYYKDSFCFVRSATFEISPKTH